ALYFATRLYFGRLAGILASFFLATSYWHVTLSRTGFRAILIPLFVAAFTAFVGYTISAVKRGKKVQSYLFAALAGATFFGGFYTYIAYRVMVGVVFGILFLLLLAALHPNIGFPHMRRYGRQTLVGLLVGVLVLSPLGWYFIQHPEAFVGRAEQVSIFNPDLQREYGGGTLHGTLLFSLRETLLSFFVGEGDTNWRHNVAGFPLLNPVVGLLFLLGLAWTFHGTVAVFWNIVRGREIHLGMVYPYVLLLMLGMLLPIITTAEGIPHGLRSVGLIVPIFLLAGTAGSVIVHWISRKVSSPARGVFLGIVAGLLVLSALYDGALYFIVARQNSGAAYAYRSDLTEVAAWLRRYAAEHPEGPRPHLVLDAFSRQTIHFLTSVEAHNYQSHPDEERHIYQSVDPATSHLVQLAPGDIIIFTQSTIPVDPERFEQVKRNTVELVEIKYNRFGQEIMRIYRVRDSGQQRSAPQTEEFNLDA
ncbi:MAG: hypothetical protein ACREQV_05415, partial [Candidatus Binatia bacterium]